MLFVEILDQTYHEFEGGILLRGAMLAFVHRAFHFAQQAFMFFVRHDHSRQYPRQYAALLLGVDC